MAPREARLGAVGQAFEISPQVAQQARVRPLRRDHDAPTYRPLRIYSLDPSVSVRLGGVAVVQVPYEKLERGPLGALFDIRCDEAPRELNVEPLDLDDPYLLMSSGLSPTPADGRFHLQMVYAVCSLTYSVFKRALGREIAWATEPSSEGPLRLTIRPFVRGANAGYSREGGGVTFGVFRANRRAAGFTIPGGLISTALSHDVIAHETTHALLDGLRSSFMEPTNVDVPAFHEGFSDLVALFLHFTYSDVVEQAIRDSRGSLASGSLLSDVAREFGYARSRNGKANALRSGVDVAGVAAFDSDIAPSEGGTPTQYHSALDPHALGSVLVSAVFEAFVTIVRRKCERLFRIAGLDPRAIGQAALSEALVKAVAQEASDVAGQFLNVCIRAIDYCPPTDIELGEYLRAMITGDGDIERTDKWGFREALMRSFRRRGIFPDHVHFMAEDAVRWQPPRQDLKIPELAFRRLRFGDEPGQPSDVKELERQAHALGALVTNPAHAGSFQLLPLTGRRPKGIVQVSPAIVQSVRVTRRVAPDGGIAFDLVGEVTQSCTVQRSGVMFDMNGGCTVIVDPEGKIRYSIYKRLDSENRRARQQAAMRGPLKRFWTMTGRQWKPRGDALRQLHAAR